MSYKAACTAIAAAAALALSGTAAHAATTTKTMQKAVQVADLDLSTSEGRSELKTRLNQAAREVCGMNEVQTGTRVPSKQARKCLRETQEKMTAQFAHLLEDESLGG